MIPGKYTHIFLIAQPLIRCLLLLGTVREGLAIAKIQNWQLELIFRDATTSGPQSSGRERNSGSQREDVSAWTGKKKKNGKGATEVDDRFSIAAVAAGNPPLLSPDPCPFVRSSVA